MDYKIDTNQNNRKTEMDQKNKYQILTKKKVC